MIPFLSLSGGTLIKKEKGKKKFFWGSSSLKENKPLGFAAILKIEERDVESSVELASETIAVSEAPGQVRQPGLKL